MSSATRVAGAVSPRAVVFGLNIWKPPELGKCGNLACFWRDFQGARGKGGTPFLQSRHFQQLYWLASNDQRPRRCDLWLETFHLRSRRGLIGGLLRPAIP